MRIKPELNRKLPISIILFLSLVISCIHEQRDLPLEEDQNYQQYMWAAKALDIFSIYRDRLPPDLYAFSTPEALYNYIDDYYTYFANQFNTKIILSKLLATEECGVGIRFDSTESGFVIKNVFPDAPGQRAGLHVSDTIIQIDGKRYSELSNENVESLLYGTSGTSVLVTVKRGDQEFLIEVTRSEYKSPSVFIDSIDALTAYIRLEVFLNETNTPGGSAQEFNNALKKTSWAEYTIFDLRGNPGGIINQCISILGELVPPGTQIISTSEREYDAENNDGFTKDSIYIAHGNASAASRNMIILADSLSASASEILISCIKTNRPLVKVIGDTTYGKGIGQTILLKEPDSVMASITSLQIFRTDGSSYHKTGIAPDIAVNSGDADEMALNLIAENSGLSKRRAGHFNMGGYMRNERVWKPFLIKEIQRF